jgi:hypothetical protein
MERLPDKVSPYRTVRIGWVSDLFCFDDPVRTKVRRVLVYPLKIPGYDRRTTLFQVKIGAEFLDRDPALRLTVCIHIVFEQFEDLRMAGHRNDRFSGISGSDRIGCRISGTAARDRSGDVLLSLHRRIRSNRNRQISSGTCRHPGGWGNPESLRAALRRHRCAGQWSRSCEWFSLQCLMMTGSVLACVHQSYGYRTIITHMRINHLKDRLLTHHNALPFHPVLYTSTRLGSGLSPAVSVQQPANSGQTTGRNPANRRTKRGFYPTMVLFIRVTVSSRPEKGGNRG